jgi:hypothetical protein
MQSAKDAVMRTETLPTPDGSISLEAVSIQGYRSLTLEYLPLAARDSKGAQIRSLPAKGVPGGSKITLPDEVPNRCLNPTPDDQTITLPHDTGT